MRLTIINLLNGLGVNDKFYWGKRIVKPLAQPGSFKNHALIANWIKPETIRLEVRAGLSGKTLTTKELSEYPLQFQSETFFDLAVEGHDGERKKSTDDETSKSGKGSASGGGHRPKRALDEKLSGMFSSAHSEKIPTHARLARGVVMGMEIGRDALESVFNMFCDHVRAGKVLATDLLASAGKAITRVTPPPFMSPRGDETKVYKYDREKNEPMFGVVPT
jgi:hypothetical protein